MIAHDLLLHVLEKEPLGLINAGFSMTFAFCVIQSTVLKHWQTQSTGIILSWSTEWLEGWVWS